MARKTKLKKIRGIVLPPTEFWYNLADSVKSGERIQSSNICVAHVMSLFDITFDNKFLKKRFFVDKKPNIFFN